MTATQGVAPPPFDNAMAQAYMQMVQCPMEGVTRFFWTCSGYVRSTIQITHWWITSQRRSWFLYVLLWTSKKQKGLSISMTSVFQDVAGTFSKGFNTTKASVAPIFQLRVSVRWLVIHPRKLTAGTWKKGCLETGQHQQNYKAPIFLGFKILVLGGVLSCWMDRAAEADVPWITSCTVPLKIWGLDAFWPFAGDTRWRRSQSYFISRLGETKTWWTRRKYLGCFKIIDY